MGYIRESKSLPVYIYERGKSFEITASLSCCIAVYAFVLVCSSVLYMFVLYMFLLILPV